MILLGRVFYILILGVSLNAAEIDYKQLHKVCYEALTYAYFSPKYSEPTSMYTKANLEITSVTKVDNWIFADLFIDARDPGMAIIHVGKDGKYTYVTNGTSFAESETSGNYVVLNGWHIPKKVFAKSR